MTREQKTAIAASVLAATGHRPGPGTADCLRGVNARGIEVLVDTAADAEAGAPPTYNVIVLGLDRDGLNALLTTTGLTLKG
jgi:hypothetical protein